MDHRSPHMQDPGAPRRLREDEQLYSEQGQRDFDPQRDASDADEADIASPRYRNPDNGSDRSRVPGMQQGNQSAWRPGSGQGQHEASGDRQSGGFMGRGRGTGESRRSDERLQELICERLTDDLRIDAADVDVKVQGRAVTLTGMVSDRHQQELIVAVVGNCDGVADVRSELSLRRGNEAGKSSFSNLPNESPT